jgi:regulation of enolase protein 1 (concanavalin A-like superfamily)
MASSATAGLAVTAHNNSVLNTATFDSVSSTMPVPDFSLTATPSSQTVTVGGSTSHTATVTALNGFSGTVTLSVSGLPTGATASFNPSSVVDSGGSTLSVSTLGSTPPGTYILTITGTSGSLTHSTTASFVISGVPAGWTDLDIGSPGMAGSASYNAGTFTVNGGGADIWYASDQFNYVYQSLTGDLTITARVASQQNTASWAKAGVMIRETTAANSAFVFVMVTPASGVNMQYRPAAGSNAVQLAQVASASAPYWVRLVRSGNTFTGYSSADGVTWTQVGSINLTMASSATAGLAVTAHNNSVLNTATFDSVSSTTP